MKNYFPHIECSAQTCTKQFILTKDSDLIPPDWDRREKGKWTLGTSGLPVLDIENSSGQPIGWCVGHCIDENEMPDSKIFIKSNQNEFIDEQAIDDVYERVGGRYILIILTRKHERLYLDPYGSLAVVFSTCEELIASNLNLMGDSYRWDKDLIESLDFPRSRYWFLGGLTSKRQIRRLLPNHYLDLNAWKPVRHWPQSAADLTVEESAQENVSAIMSCLKNNIGAVCKGFRVYLCLTAGRDTRTLLACTRDLLSHAAFFTLTEKKETVDIHVASKLARKFNLLHFLIPKQCLAEEDVLDSLYTTGHSVSIKLCEAQKSLQKLDPKRALLHGVAGELGRLFYGRSTDTPDTRLCSNELLKRCRFPEKETLLHSLEGWLTSLIEFSTFNVLDLFFIEQVLGCWAAPSHYGNTTSVFELSPFNHRRIFRAMMQLPYVYRLRNQLVTDICRDLWPELLTLPFNEFTGPKNFVRKAKKLGSRITKQAVRRIVQA